MNIKNNIFNSSNHSVVMLEATGAVGGLRKYRGIPVEQLGKAIAANIFSNNAGFEILHWDEFYKLTKSVTHKN